MSAPEMWFSGYLVTGLFLMVVAVATRGKEKRANRLALIAITGGDAIDAALLIVLALLWPIWLLLFLLRMRKGDGLRQKPMFEITKIKSEEGSEAAAFILSQFEKFIFADYTEEGKASVRGYVTAESLVANDADNFAVVARLQGALVGVAKVKRKNHLSMLFVAAHCQGRGFGKQLVETSVAECKSRHPDVTHMTANSSRVGLPFFRSRGFRPTADEQEVHGVRFTPVTLELAARPRHPGAGVI